MSDERKLHELWRSGAGAAPPPTAEALRKRAASFRRKISLRNLLEQIAGAFAAVCFSWEALTAERVGQRIGALLILAGVGYVMVQIARRAAARRPALGADGATFLREELVRQRDLLRSIWSWYLGPLVPGMVVFSVDLIVQATARGAPLLDSAPFVAFLVLTFVGVDWLNRRGARQLQREIDELDASLR